VWVTVAVKFDPIIAIDINANDMSHRTISTVVTMKTAMALVKNLMGRGEADSDEIAAKIADTRTVIANHRAEAERLTTEWRDADSAEDAEKVEARRRECLRLVERGEAALPGLEAAHVQARATKARVALATHQAAMRAIYPKLRSAIESASSVQHEAMVARKAAIAELGEGVVQLHIPVIALCLPDLTAMWRNQMDRVFAAPAPQPAVAAVVQPRVAQAPARPVGAADRRVVEKPVAPVAPQPAPKQKRPLRKDTVAVGGRLVSVLRSGIDIDGFQAMTGDQIALPAEQAELLVRAGSCDYVN
jgi:hypothetical protein